MSKQVPIEPSSDHVQALIRHTFTYGLLGIVGYRAEWQNDGVSDASVQDTLKTALPILEQALPTTIAAVRSPERKQADVVDDEIATEVVAFAKALRQQFLQEASGHAALGKAIIGALASLTDQHLREGMPATEAWAELGRFVTSSPAQVETLQREVAARIVVPEPGEHFAPVTKQAVAQLMQMLGAPPR